MKNPAMFILFTFLLQACGTDVTESIEGIKWKDNYSKLGGSQAYTSFINGNVLSCSKNENQWVIIALYEISGNSLTILPKDNAKGKVTFDTGVTGSGENRVLILTSGTDEKKHKKFPLSTSSDCPLAN